MLSSLPPRIGLQCLEGHIGGSPGEAAQDRRLFKLQVTLVPASYTQATQLLSVHSTLRYLGWAMSAPNPLRDGVPPAPHTNSSTVYTCGRIPRVKLSVRLTWPG